MPKTEAPTTSLTDRISAKQKDIADAREALRLAREQPRWKPNPGELDVFDRLNEILQAQTSSAERQRKLAAFEQSIAVLESELQSLEAELRMQHEAELRRSYVAGLPSHLEKIEQLSKELETALYALGKFVDGHPLRLGQWEKIENGAPSYELPKITTQASSVYPEVQRITYGRNFVQRGY
jgi:DNA repair exonuclease SbcCD ATPase subunit